MLCLCFTYEIKIFVGTAPLSKKQSTQGKAIYIWERGVNDLINVWKMPIKLFFDQFFYDLRYKHSMIDIFSFIKAKKLAIDTESDLF
jgi:hypothetical protein